MFHELLIFVYFSRAAAMTIRTVLLSLQALLATPEPDDPQDAGNIAIFGKYVEVDCLLLVVANQYKKDRRLFEKTARHWSNVYANGKERYAVKYSRIYLIVFRRANS